MVFGKFCFLKQTLKHNAGEALPVVWGWKGEWLAVGKPPKLLEPLDCPNASKFAKSAFAEFWAVNGKDNIC